VVGTSGTVYPAAGFAAVAKEHGACVIEINPEETPMTREADVFLRGTAGQMLPQLVSSLKTRSQRGTYS
jgi:NAD-dependent deacetylase